MSLLLLFGPSSRIEPAEISSDGTSTGTLAGSSRATSDLSSAGAATGTLVGTTAGTIASGAMDGTVSGGAASYWNPSDKHADISLSASDTVAARSTNGGSNFRSVRGVTGHGSGKWYIEGVASSATETVFGIGNSTAPLTADPGSDTNGVGYYKGAGLFYNGSSVTAASWVAGDVLMLAFDASSGNIWVGKNGTWEGGGDPGAGTGAQYTGLSLGTVYPMVGFFYNGEDMTLRVASADFAYSIPSGFSAWDSGGSAADISTATAVGVALANGSISSDAVASAIASSSSFAASVFNAAGSATAIAVANAIAASVLDSAGAATAIATGNATASGVLSSDGAATAIAVGEEVAPGGTVATGDLSSAGSSTAITSGAALYAAVLEAAASGTAIATGASLAGATLSSDGAATATAVGEEVEGAGLSANIRDGRAHLRRIRTRRHERDDKDMRDLLRFMQSQEFREAA